MTNASDEAFPWVAVDPMGRSTGAAGLTKREYFASMAMMGLLAGDTARAAKEDHVAAWAIKQADALIDELNAEQN